MINQMGHLGMVGHPDGLSPSSGSMTSPATSFSGVESLSPTDMNIPPNHMQYQNQMHQQRLSMPHA